QGAEHGGEHELEELSHEALFYCQAETRRPPRSPTACIPRVDGLPDGRPTGSFGPMPHAYQALLLLGGNTGDPTATLGLAEAMIAREAGGVLARSRDHWTEPWGFEDSRLFLNRALLMETTLPPEALMRTLLRIERELGRERGSERYAAR